MFHLLIEELHMCKPFLVEGKQSTRLNNRMTNIPDPLQMFQMLRKKDCVWERAKPQWHCWFFELTFRRMCSQWSLRTWRESSNGVEQSIGSPSIWLLRYIYMTFSTPSPQFQGAAHSSWGLTPRRTIGFVGRSWKRQHDQYISALVFLPVFSLGDLGLVGQSVCHFGKELSEALVKLGHWDEQDK